MIGSQEAMSAALATGTKQQEARKGEALTGTKQEAGRGTAPTGKHQAPTPYECLWADCQALSLHRGTVPVDRLNRLRRLYLAAEPHVPMTSPEWCDALLLVAAARSVVHAGGAHEALVMLQTVLAHMRAAARPEKVTLWYAE